MKYFLSGAVCVFAVLTCGVHAEPFVYVVNTPSVQIIDVATNTIETIAALNFGDCAVITPDNAYAYVTDGNFSGPGRILVIDTATNAVVDTIVSTQFNFANVGYLAITPNGKAIYVVNDLGNTVSVVDVTTNTVTGSIDVGNMPQVIAITPDGTQAYVTSAADNVVSVIDIATNTVVDTIHSVQFNGSSGVAITPDGKTVYVANNTTVSVIDQATNAVSDDPIALANGPFGLTISPDGRTLYTRNGDNTMTVIDIATNQVVQTIEVEVGQGFIWILPDGSRAYVSNDADNTVSVVDLATYNVIATIPTDFQPWGLASKNLIAHVTGSVICNTFLNKTDLVLAMHWQPFFPNTVSYRVYDNLGRLVDTVLATEPLEFYACVGNRAQAQEFSVSAISPTGTESARIPVTIRTC